MSHHFEEKAERITFDLNTHRLAEAANVLRREIEIDPREALALIRVANQQKDPYAADRIVVKYDGDVAVRDERSGIEFAAGRMPNYDEGDRRDYVPPPEVRVEPNDGVGTGIAIGVIGGLILGHAIGDDHRGRQRR